MELLFIMNITVTTFTNPFSFFCCADNDTKNVIPLENTGSTSNVYNISKPKPKTDISDFNHGQYVAVMWKDKWVRGIVTMESQFLIWLVDYGIYVRPDDKTVYKELPQEYRKYPTKLFEASIHGVSPVDKVLTYDCQIKNGLTNIWNQGSIDKAQALISEASAIYFVPVALLSTKHNDIVLGDLYLKLNQKGYVNIVDELEMWPVFLEKNQEEYIKNLPIHYTTRRKHRASLLKPVFPDFDYEVRTITFEVSLQDYKTISEDSLAFSPCSEFSSDSEDASTVVNRRRRNEEYTLSHSEILEYSNMYVTIHDREYNVLSILMSKFQDLRMCEQYKDHDLKRVGRACSRRSSEDDF